MDSLNNAASKIYLNYFIVFKSELQNQVYSAIVDFEEIQGESTYHLFDDDLRDIIPAIEFCLHLPRVSLDTVNISIDQIMAGKYVPHNIVLIPSNMIDNFSRLVLPDFEKPTLIIYQDDCKEEASKLKEVFEPKLSSLAVNELSQVYLISIWNEISRLTKGIEGELCVPDFASKRLGEINIQLLPQLFIENQFGTVESYFDNYNSDKIDFEGLLNQAVFQKAKLLALNDFDKGLSSEEYKTLVREYIPKSRIPLTIAYPGMPPKYKKVSGANIIPPLESKAIRLMSIHHAISKNGYFYECAPVKDELYNNLYNLEDHCCKNTQKNHYIWKTLKTMGKLLSEQLGPNGVQAINRASKVTAFSNFPIGLAILPNTTAPLCCHKSISYNPLTPLTRAMQLELSRTPSVYIGKKCKVLIAECLDKTDHIRPHSDYIWKSVNELAQNNQDFDVIKTDITSIKDMKKFLSSNADADILVISAHGRYAKESNMSGLVIGNETWMAHENEIIIPPLVLLSACHVSPRGSGSVNITDLLLRSGAIAVLGTFIPVDVIKNGLLMLRFFIYIIEAMNNRQDFRSIDEIWQFVVSSNAINEIVASTQKLSEWAHKRNSSGISPIEEFMLQKSKGKLSYTHIYNDTISVLRELAARDGISYLFDNSISSQGYFPESIFYQFVGRPENIIVNDPILKKNHKIFHNL